MRLNSEISGGASQCMEDLFDCERSKLSGVFNGTNFL